MIKGKLAQYKLFWKENEKGLGKSMYFCDCKQGKW